MQTGECRIAHKKTKTFLETVRGSVVSRPGYCSHHTGGLGTVSL